MVNAILISDGGVLKRSSKPVMKGSRVNLSKKRKTNIKNF